MTRSIPSFTPDLSKAGTKTKEGDGGQFAWFSPPDAPTLRFRYAVIKEEAGVISLLPGEARFKKGLMALRWPDQKGGESTVWRVSKTRPNRIDLERVEPKA